MLTSALLMQKLATRKLTGNDDISKALTKEYRKMSSDMPLSELSRILEKKNFVFVDSKYIVSN
jgi:thiamine biosynthesis lipoprotein ApbE